MRTAAVIFATIVMLVVIIMVAFPYVILIRIMEYNAMYPTFRAPRINISDLYPHIRTGDIMLFASTTRMMTNSGALQKYFSHAGICLRKGELVYLCESQQGTELMPHAGKEITMKSGVDIVPLLVRLKYYSGSYYIIRLSHPLDEDREATLLRLSEKLYRENFPYPTIVATLKEALFGARVARHCFQNIGYLLDCANLTPLDLKGALLHDMGVIRSAQEVCEISGRALPDGYYYERPMQIAYDIDSMKIDTP